MSLSFRQDIGCALERYARQETGRIENARCAAWLERLTVQEAGDAVGALLPDFLAMLTAQGVALLDFGMPRHAEKSRAQRGSWRVSVSDHTPHLVAPAIEAYWRGSITPAGALQFDEQVRVVASEPRVAAYLTKHCLPQYSSSTDYARSRVFVPLVETYSSATMSGFLCGACGAPLPDEKVRQRQQAFLHVRRLCGDCLQQRH